MCAEDSQKHQVAIKMMKIDSPEYRILKTLCQENMLYSPNNFACIMPPLDFLELGEHCFVVMPRFVGFAI